jgi:hypothetical protein
LRKAIDAHGGWLFKHTDFARWLSAITALLGGLPYLCVLSKLATGTHTAGRGQQRESTWGRRLLIMKELEQVAHAVRSFAMEVRQLGYSSLAGGHENAFLELSERMIRHADEVNRRRPAS